MRLSKDFVSSQQDRRKRSFARLCVIVTACERVSVAEDAQAAGPQRNSRTVKFGDRHVSFVLFVPRNSGPQRLKETLRVLYFKGLVR